MSEEMIVPEVFLSEVFGELRTTEIEDKTYFCGIDVARALGYSNPRDAVGRHCKSSGIVKCDVATSHKAYRDSFAEQVKATPFINEGNVYRLIVRSKLQTAEQFEHWVFDEALPTIRKTGGYVNNAEQFVEHYLPHSSVTVRTQVVQMLEVVKAQDTVIGVQKPSVEFTRAVTESGDNIDIGGFAKILQKDGFPNVGRNKMFDWLRENGYLMKGSVVPYQKHINAGIFKVQEKVYYTGKYSHIAKQTLITPKGQQVLAEKYREWVLKVEV